MLRNGAGKPTELQVAIGALIAAAAALTCHMILAADGPPIPLVFTALFAATLGGCAYGLANGRAEAPVITVVTTVATGPFGLDRILWWIVYPPRSTIWTIFYVATLTWLGALVLACVLVNRRPVREYLAERVPDPSPTYVDRLRRRAGVLVMSFVTAAASAVVCLFVGFKVMAHATPPASLDFAFQLYPESGDSRLILILALLLAPPTLLCLIGASRADHSGRGRRIILVGLWTYACYGVPVTLSSAHWVVSRWETWLHESGRLVVTVGLLSEVVAFGCAFAALLALLHPAANRAQQSDVDRSAPGPLSVDAG